jgi:hypothetical protein
MIKDSRNFQKNKSAWAKIVFLLCSFACLSACSTDLFPIPGSYSELGESPLSPTTRIVLSILWYGLNLAILTTIPIYLDKSFENTSFYLRFKVFWWVGGILYPVLISMVIGIFPGNMFPFNMLPLNNPPSFNKEEVITYLIFVAIVSAIVWCLTILPASMQHKKKIAG